MRHWMIVIALFSIGPALAEKKGPETPPAPVTLCSAIISVDGQAVQDSLIGWRREQARKLGPPAPLWVNWRLRQLPTALHEAVTAGCEPVRMPTTTINVSELQPGLWQMIAFVTPEVLVESPQLILAAGWRAFEVKTGQTTVLATMQMKPPAPLDIMLKLDRRPAEFDQVGICIFDDHGVVDLVVMSMTTQAARMRRAAVPSGKVEVVALILSDKEPNRRGRAKGLNPDGTIVVNIGPPEPPKEPPSASTTDRM